MGGIPSAGVRRNGCWIPPPFFGGRVRIPVIWGIPSACVRRNGCWIPPPFFVGGVGPTTTTINAHYSHFMYPTMIECLHLTKHTFYSPHFPNQKCIGSLNLFYLEYYFILYNCSSMIWILWRYGATFFSSEFQHRQI